MKRKQWNGIGILLIGFFSAHAFVMNHMRRHGAALSSEFSYLNTSHLPLTLLFMGKGDGKKKRKKSSSNTSTSSSSSYTPPPTAPLRVTNQINVPVRRQIMYAQLNKQAQRNSGQTSFRQVRRTSYRRQWDEEEIEEKAEERRRKGQDPDWDVILNRTASAPLVLVDGYNIIHQWSRLKKHMVKGDTKRARDLLVDDLENLRSLKGWRLEVVFDGTGRSITGPLGSNAGGSKATPMDQATRKDVTKYGVRVVYTGVGVEADSYIEKRCADAKNITKGQLTSSLIVASDDAMIRVAAQSAGAYVMRSERFVTELKAVKKAMEFRVEAAMSKVNGHAIRPEKLRGTAMVHRFGRGSVLIEDKRNRTKVKKSDLISTEEEVDDSAEEHVEEGIPWWAKVPDDANLFRKPQN
ncbi:hypothetical protein FisN_2Hh444 [Fistulifera solaris]|jgi:predicted RNA-binding protein with PIN domain|uniref:NYN domain-containing protein n=1 Tax=Fistulifera solaris TaxID=1519565 RepID=A0A1Z5JG20_FISSO|nr:hypothetical protein FisN_2Hh444 [Fistulifera solaris]|eukprot:GAX12953.1 hypothetical protein FisN_2Hh444 [Fistulifera solaris]